MLPKYSTEDAPVKTNPDQTVEMTEFFKEFDQQSEIVAVAEKSAEPSPLEIIQKDLELMVMGEEAGQLAISTCVSNIMHLQGQAQAKAEKSNLALIPEKSLGYYMTLATDFTKLIKHICNKMAAKDNDTVRECFAAVDASGQQSLANVAIDMFTHLVAYDSGVVRKQMQ